MPADRPLNWGDARKRYLAETTACERDRIADLERRLAEAEAAHAADRELLRRALEALSAISVAYCDAQEYQAEWLAVDKVLSSPEAKRAMEERG